MPSYKKVSIGFLFSLYSTLAMLVPVYAQDIDSLSNIERPYAYKGVRTMLPDKYADSAAGKRFGSAIVYASVTAEETYDDNIYAAQDKTGDFMTALKPEFRLEQNIRRHALTLWGTGKTKFYKDHSEDNTTDFSLGLKLDLEAKRSLHFPVSVSYQKSHRERANRLSALATREPIGFKTLNVRAGTVFNPNRLTLEAHSGYEQLRLDNGFFRLSGLPSIENDGDTDRYFFETAARYELRQGLKPFAQLRYTDAQYLRSTHTGTGYNGAKRDYKAWRGLIGLALSYEDRVSGRIAAGRENRTYDSPALADQENGVIEAELGWRPTELLSIGLSFEDTNREDALIQSGADERSFALLVAYAWHEKTSLYARGGLLNRQFAESIREDDLHGVSLGFDHMFTPRISIGAAYTYQKNESSAAGFDYDRNMFTVRAAGAL